MLRVDIVCWISSGGATPRLQKTRRLSKEQSFQSFTSLNSGYSASVHEGETAFSGSYTGCIILTVDTTRGGTSSTPSRSASSSPVLSRMPKQPFAPTIPAAQAATAADATEIVSILNICMVFASSGGAGRRGRVDDVQ